MEKRTVDTKLVPAFVLLLCLLSEAYCQCNEGQGLDVTLVLDTSLNASVMESIKSVLENVNNANGRNNNENNDNINNVNDIKVAVVMYDSSGSAYVALERTSFSENQSEINRLLDSNGNDSVSNSSGSVFSLVLEEIIPFTRKGGIPHVVLFLNTDSSIGTANEAVQLKENGAELFLIALGSMNQIVDLSSNQMEQFRIFYVNLLENDTFVEDISQAACSLNKPITSNKCGSKARPLDVTFVLDDSQTVTKTHFDLYVKESVKNVIHHLWDQSGQNKIRFAIVVYGGYQVNVLINFNHTFPNKASALSAVDNIVYTGQWYGQEKFKQAFQVVEREIVPLTRKGNVPHIVLLVHTLTSVPAEAQSLKATGALLFILGTNSTYQDLYEVIASRVEYASVFYDIRTIVNQSIDVAAKVCDVKSLIYPGDCSPQTPSVDITFVLQDSDSVSSTYFNTVLLPLCKNIVKSFVELGKFRTRTASVTFGATATVRYNLNLEQPDLSMMFELMNLLIIHRGEHGVANLPVALSTVRTQVVPVTRRLTIPHFVIVLTDGLEARDQVRKEAELLKSTGAIVFAIGIGDKVDQSNLNIVASQLDYVFLLKDSNDVILNSFKIVSTACGSNPSLTPQTNNPLNVSNDTESIKSKDLVDLTFVLDVSTGMPSVVFHSIVKTTVRAIINRLWKNACQLQDTVRVATLLDSHVAFNLKSFLAQKEHVLQAVDMLEYAEVNQTSWSSAAAMLQAEVLPNTRQGRVPHFIIVLTASNVEENVEWNLDKWPNSHVIAVGIGQTVTRASLDMIATKQEFVSRIQSMPGSIRSAEEIVQWIKSSINESKK